MTTKRWRGLSALVRDAVEHGSIAIERVQKETADRPFAILEMLGPIAGPVRVIHAVHDASVSSVHLTIRLINRAAGLVADKALDAIDRDPPA